MKALKLDLDSDSDSEVEKWKNIINVEPSATVATPKIQLEDRKEPEEGECLFNSEMWVNGVPLHFIIDNGSQKNLRLVEVFK
jgi:hypothetical protein